MDKKEKSKPIKKEKNSSDENGNVLITEFFKIYDPNSKKVYVAKRGDS